MNDFTDFWSRNGWRDWDWEEKLEANRLLNVQDQLARAARIIWRAIQRKPVA